MLAFQSKLTSPGMKKFTFLVDYKAVVLIRKDSSKIQMTLRTPTTV